MQERNGECFQFCRHQISVKLIFFNGMLRDISSSVKTSLVYLQGTTKFYISNLRHADYLCQSNNKCKIDNMKEIKSSPHTF